MRALQIPKQSLCLKQTNNWANISYQLLILGNVKDVYRNLSTKKQLPLLENQITFEKKEQKATINNYLNCLSMVFQDLR